MRDPVPALPPTACTSASVQRANHAQRCASQWFAQGARAAGPARGGHNHKQHHTPLSTRNDLSFRPRPDSCEVLENPRFGRAVLDLGTTTSASSLRSLSKRSAPFRERIGAINHATVTFVEATSRLIVQTVAILDGVSTEAHVRASPSTGCREARSARRLRTGPRPPTRCSSRSRTASVRRRPRRPRRYRSVRRTRVAPRASYRRSSWSPTPRRKRSPRRPSTYCRERTCGLGTGPPSRTGFPA
jgi:hypothetical protein